MDESWRCTMGSVLPRHRSSSDQHAGAAAGGGHQSLAPDDFRDVYGGPPRTVLLRSFAGEAADYHSPAGVHQYTGYGGGEAFCRRPYADGRAAAAAVPTEQGFFDDIFGARRHMRSRSKSKSSSAVSSDEFPSAAGFCRPPVATGGSRADATLSSFTSRLRPVTIPSRRYDSSPPSSTSTRGTEYQSSFTCSTAAYPAVGYYYGGDDAKAAGSRSTSNHSRAVVDGGSPSPAATRHHRNHRGGSRSFCCFTSSNPETSSDAPSFRQAAARGAARSPGAETTVTDYSGADDYGYYYHSPPSATSSSLFTNPLAIRTPRRLEDVAREVRERAPLLLMDDGGDIDSVGAAAVDEAIAWAKERFWSQAR